MSFKESHKMRMYGVRKHGDIGCRCTDATSECKTRERVAARLEIRDELTEWYAQREVWKEAGLVNGIDPEKLEELVWSAFESAPHDYWYKRWFWWWLED